MRNPPCENRIDPIAQPIRTYSKVLISEEQIPVDPAVAAEEVELMVVMNSVAANVPPEQGAGIISLVLLDILV